MGTQALAQQCSIILIRLFYRSKAMIGVLWTIMCNSCKRMDKPAKQAKMPTEGLELKYSFHAQETY